MITIKKLLDKYGLYLYILLGSLFIITFIYIICEVSPFGGNSLLTIDFFHQYGPMLGELYDRVKNSSNLLYSFNMGMGLPFFKNYFNYMSSIFNIIILFVNRNHLLTSYSFIIGLKAVASSIAMGIFLNKKIINKKRMIPVLSIMYAFCNYFVAYYWNIMWSDGLVYLPLIILGVELLVDKNKFLLYTISLGLMLFSNYFIAYMICIFVFFYFLVYLFLISDVDKRKYAIKKCLLFSICSVIAAGLSAFSLIPMFNSMSSISATSDTWPTSQYYDFTLIEYIYNHLSGVTVTVLNSGSITAPNISVGIMAVPLTLLFLSNKKINYKIKIGYFILLGILITSFFWAPLDFIWHAFHVPNDLPYRYSFLYSFVMIVISAYAVDNIDTISDWILLIIYALMLVFVGILLVVDIFDLSNKIILLNVVVLSIWFFGFILYKLFKVKGRYISFIYFITVLLEFIIGINNNWDISQDLKSFYSEYDKIQNSLVYIRNTDDDKFYRIEKDNIHTFNDPSWYNYYGITAFSSMEYENLAVLHRKLGAMGNNINSFYNVGNTPIYNMIFNLRYLLGVSNDPNYSLYFEDAISDNYVYRSNYSGSLMYEVSSDIKLWNYVSDNPFVVQESFIEEATGVKGIFKKVDPAHDDIVNGSNGAYHTYKYNNVSGYIYLGDNINSIIIDKTLYYLDSEAEKIDINNNYNNSQLLNEPYILYVSDVSELTVAFKDNMDEYLYFYVVDYDKLNEAYEVISDSILEITEFKESAIKARYNAKGGSVYTSIPYDNGWNVYIDGKKVDTYEIGGALLGFDIEPGEHDIKLNYQIPYFKLSILINIVSVGSLIFISKRKKVD